MSEAEAPKISYHLNTRLLPVVTGIVALFAVLDGYRGWSVLLIVLGGVWLIAFLWARALMQGLSLRREMRFGWAQVGDRLEERFTLVNQAPIQALWVEVLDQTNMPGYRANQVRGVDGNAENRWQIEGVCMHRGLYILGPTRLRTGDPFGIYSVTIDDPASTTLMVMPPIVSLPPIEVAPGGRTGDGSPRVNAPQFTVSSASVRAYLPGDSLRWIHWPTSARRGSLFVRILEGVPAGDWLIVLDLAGQSQIGSGQDSTMEHGIILAASLADQGMRSGHSVGLVAHGQDLVWLPPGMSDEHNWSILRSLALVEAGERPLVDLLELIRPSLGRDTSVIMITPDVSSAWIEGLLALRRQGAVVTALIFDPQTFGGAEAVTGLKDMLIDLGIDHEIVPQDLLNQPESSPGTEGQWEWRVTPLGRAVPKLQDSELAWRRLSDKR